MIYSMKIWGEVDWFALQARQYQENLAAANVANLDLEVFLPRIREEQSICGTTRKVTKALFPGYFFAQFSPLQSYDAVRYTPGVVRVVGAGRLPIPVGAEIVAAIREREQADGFIRLERTSFKPGESVRVEKGALAGWMGKVEQEWDDGRRVSILLETIQRARVLIDRDCLVAG